MTAFAVLGTDTGVGKTVLTAGLVGRLREDGVDARAVKPVQTGYPPDDDAAFVRAACGEDGGDPVQSESLAHSTEAHSTEAHSTRSASGSGDRAAVCLRRLEPPLAPAVAAERQGVDLSYEALRAGCRDALAATRVGVLEGVGGLRVPLADGREVVDLVADLDLPAILVGRSGLGTLNHTALSVEALDRRGIDVEAIVLNEFEGATVAERTNPEVVEEMTGVSVYTVPRAEVGEPPFAVELVREHLPRLFTG